MLPRDLRGRYRVLLPPSTSAESLQELHHSPDTGAKGEVKRGRCIKRPIGPWSKARPGICPNKISGSGRWPHRTKGGDRQWGLERLPDN